ncbi:MAG: FAD-dependent oxidoreductase [Syntrophaceae bacterium]|nr:FAD-dependent oxidoreductase [Syntrophaceae bacterium]
MDGNEFDLIVIGGGAAGFVSSKLAAGLGKKVALVERDRLGGECTWNGCVPSKTLIRSARACRQIRDGERFGLRVEGPLRIDPSGVLDHVRAVVNKVYEGHPPESFRGLGIDVRFGSPRFLDPHRIDLDGTVLSARRFVIATGSGPLVPPVPGLESVPFLTNRNVFALERLPASLLVLGGGAVGIELSAALNRLGVETTVVEMLPRVLMREDRELADRLAGMLEAEGVRILTGRKAVAAASRDGGIVLTVEDAAGQRSDLEAEAVLVAVGRRPNVEGLDLDRAGVAFGPKGIETNGALRTTAPGIYACGDVVGPFQFSHMAEYQARIATLNALLPFRRKADYRLAGWCTYTDPELAHLGLTEEEAREALGDGIDVYRWSYGAIDRGRTDGTEEGMVKVICDRRGRVVGAHILGERAGELIHEIQLLRFLDVPFHRAESMIHLYPTYNDAIKAPSRLAYRTKLERSPFLKILRAVVSFGKQE